MGVRSVGIYTLGCKVSQYESSAIGEEFSRRGVKVRPFSEVCDAYVINTCTVTAESDRKSRQIIRRAISKNPAAVEAVVGCYTQRAPSEVAQIEGVDIILGTADKLSVVDRVLSAARGRTEISVSDLSGTPFEPMHIESAPRTRAYVKIEDGCEAKCTYCAISAARGPVRSKPRDEVIREVESLYRRGTREIVLTGIETGSYGADFEEKYTLADLVLELDKRGSCERLRLGSLAPELVGREFIEKVAGTKILVPHFHLSLQSGSTAVLRRMKRRYTAERAYENILRIKEYMPSSQFTADLMVGFPGETREEFAVTCDFVRRVRFLDAHVFAYSRREGTPAAYYEGQVDEAEKHERSRELISLVASVRDGVLSDIVARGEPLRCIAERVLGGVALAHSDEFCEVRARTARTHNR